MAIAHADKQVSSTKDLVFTHRENKKNSNLTRNGIFFILQTTTLVDATPAALGQAMKQNDSNKKRSRNNRKNRQAVSCSDSVSDSSSSQSSSVQSPPRRRRRGRGGAKKNGQKMQQQQQQQVSLEEQANYVAMDCEMVGVGADGLKSALARVTMVDWNGDTVLDMHVKPADPVTDYRTFVSGITAADLENAVSIDVCQVKVLDILEGKVLVGHHLKNDLKAIGVSHPWYMTRDTAKWEPFMKVRFNDGILWPRKLKELCQEKLKRDIQLPGHSHCPVEDAVAALDLYKLVRSKWEKAMEYKMNKTKEIMQQQISEQQAAQ